VDLASRQDAQSLQKFLFAACAKVSALKRKYGEDSYSMKGIFFDHPYKLMPRQYFVAEEKREPQTYFRVALQRPGFSLVEVYVSGMDDCISEFTEQLTEAVEAALYNH